MANGPRYVWPLAVEDAVADALEVVGLVIGF